MKKGKSILSVLLIFILMFSAAACAKSKTCGESISESVTETMATVSEKARDDEVTAAEISVTEFTEETQESSADAVTSRKRNEKTESRSTTVSGTVTEKATGRKTRIRTEYTTVHNTVTTAERTTKQPPTTTSAKATQTTFVTEAEAAVSPGYVIVSPTEEARIPAPPAIIPGTTGTTASPKTTAKATAPETSATVQETKQETKQETVKVIVSCRNAVKYGKTDVPQSGIILSTQVNFAQGDTALDVLKKALHENGIGINESRGYIKGIGGLNEKDCGGSSGWMYMVNSDTPMTPSGKYEVSPGDTVTFYYVTSYGDKA